MSYEAVGPIWRVVRDRFQKTVATLKEEDLALSMTAESSSIAHMIRHNAEVEYMFGEWFFGASVPEDVTYIASGQSSPGHERALQLEQLIAFSAAAEAFLTDAMKQLSDEAWDTVVESKIGPSTPREALGRAIYHTGLHAGQIALIRKHAPQPSAQQ
ncbi:DinB family protein [Paenibacillus silvisoli]|uniref:DinB family protein n=1 Tax=Paenibacillus silvisoli TaxID=3110539 RepID=UPI00280563A3|nr:DinB family protein [Paenibacillus silvisoli]